MVYGKETNQTIKLTWVEVFMEIIAAPRFLDDIVCIFLTSFFFLSLKIENSEGNTNYCIPL